MWTVVAGSPLTSSDIGQPGGQPLDVIRMNADNGTEQVMARRPALPAIEEEEGLAEGESALY